jgi:hypothetical protein
MVNGAQSTTVAAGEPVVVHVHATAPSPGVIVELRLDPTGAGALDDPELITPSAKVVHDTETVFSEPGTYFLAARATAQTAGKATDLHARVPNIARARITVT